ncbi:GNAT family N-acetyltransferase [Dietzia cinnamea]|uniref:GNAT family N-acetyltransferase n=1 Tax=Dietzia cinnamea TaxID=321318 RepID=UPI00223AC6FE|nr:GNAT family N-acetyltransferase [Dietzia cinnamea]MCT2062822.1 N-acetyltransferase [Dietzia cinnamea]MCT2237599.1 N-acetyltransferase [Dietzia cinnamea]
MSSADNVQVRRDVAAGRFEVLVDDVVAGYADYSDSTDGVREFPHTVVASEFGGRGLAGTLVGEALRVTRDEDLRVRPTCSFVAAYLDKHPDAAEVA